MFAASFKVPSSTFRVEMVTDADMRKEFGVPSTSKHYYQIKNVDNHRRTQLKWYMERFCFLTKFDYMSKEAFNPLRSAKLGYQVDWAGILYDKLIVEIQAKDKRKSSNRDKLIPYLQALFAPKMVVPLQSFHQEDFGSFKVPPSTQNYSTSQKTPLEKVQSCPSTLEHEEDLFGKSFMDSVQQSKRLGLQFQTKRRKVEIPTDPVK